MIIIAFAENTSKLLPNIFCKNLKHCAPIMVKPDEIIMLQFIRYKKIAEIGSDGTASAKIRKRLSNKTLMAKKDGYKSVPLVLDAVFQPISILNLLNPISWAIDLGTGKCCKWDNDIIEVQMQDKK